MSCLRSGRRLGFLRQAGIVACFVLLFPACLAPASPSFLPLARSGAARGQSVYRQAGQAMGTSVEVSVYGVSDERAENACDRAFEELNRVEKLLSFYDPGSELSILNQKTGQGCQPVSPEMFLVLQEADRAWRDTHRGFDPSLGPLIKLWKRTIKEGALPSETELIQAQSVSGWSRIAMEKNWRGGSIQMPPGYCLDLGGVAKGYGVDQAVRILRQAGIRSGIVNAGGDLLVWGHPTGRRRYAVGVIHPRQANGSLAGVLRCRNCAVVTSGDYEQWTVIDNQRYSHVINPNTGRPSSGVASVTVVAHSAARADSLATGLMAIGPEAARMAIPRLKDAEVLIMLSEGDTDLQVWASPGLIPDWEPSAPDLKAQPLTAPSPRSP